MLVYGMMKCSKMRSCPKSVAQGGADDGEDDDDFNDAADDNGVVSDDN